MELQPVHGVPALKAGNSLVIGDLHIGVESHLRAKGFHLTSHTSNMMESIISSVDDDINRLIVIGDVKDSVPGSTKQEYAEIPDFFEELLERFDMVDVVRGNHDTRIEEFLPGRVRIRPSTGMVLEDVGLVHGHMWPSDEVMACDTLVMAHNHPAVMFRDGIGRQTTEPCWFRGTFDPSRNDRYPAIPRIFMVIPAFNRMLGGSPVNVRGEDLLGPILNSDMLNLDDAHLYLLDGIDLGRRADLMIDARRQGRFKDGPERRAKYSRSQVSDHFVHGAGLEMPLCRYGILGGIADGHEEDASLVAGDVERFLRFGIGEVVAPAGAEPYVRSLHHRMRGGDRDILIAGMDALLQRIVPFLILAIREQQHDGGAEHAGGQLRHPGHGLLASEDVYPEGLEILPRRGEHRSLDDLVEIRIGHGPV